MTRAPEPRPPFSRGPHSLRRRPACPSPAARDRLLDDLRATLAAACLGQDAALQVDHLGARPVRSSAELAARVDTLALELLARMDAEGWDPGAAPRAVTSVLAASVPAAEAVLLRAASRARVDSSSVDSASVDSASVDEVR